MKRLLLLQMELESSPQPIEGFDEFRSLAHDEGLRIETVRLPGELGERVNVAEVHHQIRTAHGFWIRQTHLLRNSEIRAIVESRLKDGAIAIAELRGLPSEPIDHQFFQDYGLESSSIRAVRLESSPFEYPHPMLVPVDRELYPSGFRDPTLFRGVHRLILQGANGIGCFGDAEPILAIPAGQIRLLEVRSDYFVDSLPRPEFPVMAEARRDNWRGRIVALNAALFGDAYSGPLGALFPGITAADNRQFARNLLRAVGSGERYEGPSWEAMFSLIDKFETEVTRLTENVLKKRAKSNWFSELIPDEIQEKCTKRWSDEKKTFTKAAYLDLVDYVKIWKTHWDFFAVLFEQVAPPPSRTRSLKFLQRANQWRKLTAHPSRRFYAQLPPPTDEDLNEMRGFVLLVSNLQDAERRKT